VDSIITQPMLFPESPEAQIARLDSEILNLLLGHSGGPLGLPMADDEKKVLRTIRYARGLANAITIAEIREKTDYDVRVVKKCVRALRMNYRLPIGSSKHGTDGGYFLMITGEDRAIWVKDVLDQVRAELAVLHAAAGQQATLELLGQLQIEVRS